MEWHDYVDQILSCEISFDGITLSFDDNIMPRDVPPIIKASVLMLDRMMECQGNFNILVFPERIQSIFVFTLVKLIYNISEGRINHDYDPSAFKMGDKLKFGNTIVEFVTFEVVNGTKRMKIELADSLTISASVEYFPFFQHTITKKKLSRYKQFVEAKIEAEKLLTYMTATEKHLQLLADYKTHMDSSVVYMTSIINTKELLSRCKLFRQSAKDIFLIGQADYEGNVENIGKGQLDGTPAIVLASNLYTIVAMAQQDHPIQSIVIDGSNANALLSQIDALDELMKLGVPITCVTDIVNSFDLQPFLYRKFNLWRWDETSITDKLFNSTPLKYDNKVIHCAKRNIDYITTDGKEISSVIKNLSIHRSESQTLSAQMLKLFDRFYSLAFTALRETVPFEKTYLTHISLALNECASILDGEKNFLDQKTYEDYISIVDCMKKVFSIDYTLPKHEALGSHLYKKRYKNVCIVIPERSDKKRVQIYWQLWCQRNLLSTQVFVLYPAEYYPIQCTRFSTTIIVGWLKSVVMRKILYSFNTQDYAVMLYDYEKRWKNYNTDKWNAVLDCIHNRQTIEKSFTTDKIHVSTSRFTSVQPEPEDTPDTDEFSEIEVIIRENKYRQYVEKDGQRTVSETTEAIPVNFVGGYLAFYREGHRILTATNIIANDADRVKDDDKVFPSELKLGDFVVVREADRDLIKEMADVILERSGKSNIREMATKWKEALEIESLFCTAEEIFQHLQDIGCTRGYPTVRSWLFDDDVIAPQSRQDLEHIAAYTGSSVLKEMLDQIYEAAQTVRNAHVQAGRVLSIQLRRKIVEALSEYADLDPYNIWEPIEMQVDGVGTVRVLKIIDIGAPVIIDIADTNRLIEEE